MENGCAEDALQPVRDNELKKATLTLAWGTAARNGYVSCHGGLKIFQGKEGQKDYVASFFGLSGSGKSTLTHAKHNGKYDIKVLHDDAFVISEKDGSSIALEPSYFDKTNDYPTGHPEQDFFVTVQNCVRSSVAMWAPSTSASVIMMIL